MCCSVWWRLWRCAPFAGAFWSIGGGGGDALCAALYDGGCGGVLCLPEHVGERYWMRR